MPSLCDVLTSSVKVKVIEGFPTTTMRAQLTILLNQVKVQTQSLLGLPVSNNSCAGVRAAVPPAPPKREPKQQLYRHENSYGCRSDAAHGQPFCKTILGCHLPALPCPFRRSFSSLFYLCRLCCIVGSWPLGHAVDGPHYHNCCGQSGNSMVPKKKKKGRQVGAEQWTYFECVELVNAYNIVKPKDNSEESWVQVAARLVLTGFKIAR
jgi:hypothetical protein